jgi:hypothetical protein
MGSMRAKNSFCFRKEVEENRTSRWELLITPKVLKTQKGQGILPLSVSFFEEVWLYTEKSWGDKDLIVSETIRSPPDRPLGNKLKLQLAQATLSRKGANVTVIRHNLMAKLFLLLKINPVDLFVKMIEI